MSPSILKFLSNIMLIIALWSVTECHGGGKKLGRKKTKAVKAPLNILSEVSDGRERIRELSEIETGNRDRESQLRDDFNPQKARADIAVSRKQITNVSQQIESNRLVTKLIDEISAFTEGRRHSDVVRQKEFFALVNALSKANVADEWLLSTTRDGSHSKFELNGRRYTISSQIKKVHLHSLVAHIKSIIEKQFGVQSIDELLQRETLQIEKKKAAQDELAQRRKDLQEFKASLVRLARETHELEDQKAQIATQLKESLRIYALEFGNRYGTNQLTLSAIAVKYVQIDAGHLPHKNERLQEMARLLRIAYEKHSQSLSLKERQDPNRELWHIDPRELTVRVTTIHRSTGPGRRGRGRGRETRVLRVAVFCEDLLAHIEWTRMTFTTDEHEFAVQFVHRGEELLRIQFFAEVFREAVNAQREKNRETNGDELDMLETDVHLMRMKECGGAFLIGLPFALNITLNARNLIVLYQLIAAAPVAPDALQSVIRTDELKENLRQKMGESMNDEWYVDTDGDMAQLAELKTNHLAFIYRLFKANKVPPLSGLGVGIDDAAFWHFVDKIIEFVN